MMPISKPHSSDGGNNTGSSATLVDYLDKENVELEVLANNAQSREKEIDIRSRQQSFFNGKSKNISSVEVKHSIDNNKYKLGKNDAKYFAPTINFSKNELEYLAKKATQGRAVENTWQMNKKEFEAKQVASYKDQFQWFLGGALLLLFLDILVLERRTLWVQKLNLFKEKK